MPRETFPMRRQTAMHALRRNTLRSNGMLDHLRAGLFIALLIYFGGVGSAQRSKHIRRLAEDPGRPIASRLLPDDEVVVVARDSGDRMVSNRYLTIKDVIEDATIVSNYVVVLRAARVEGQLAQN